MSRTAIAHPGRHRVVVTGLGAVTPIGQTVETFWSAALAGTVGTGPITLLDVTDFPCGLGGEITEFAAGPQRVARLATAAAVQAADDAGEGAWAGDPTRIGACIGSLNGNRGDFEPYAVQFHRAEITAPHDGSRVSPPMVKISDSVCSTLGLLGPSLVVSTACASGNTALGHAADAIAAGRADVMIAGAADEMSLGILITFTTLRSLAHDCVRPFDRDRSGLLIAEGAAALVLESYDHARDRGARIYAELAGWSSFADAHSMVAPHPQGVGARRAMEGALAHARIPSHSVDFISAHGTGTPSNDSVESAAIRKVFGSSTPAVSSLKGAMGHPQGAGSAIEAVACVLAIRDQVVPPTANLTAPDPECAMDHVMGVARRMPVSVALNNAFGFGGNTACTVFTRLDGEEIR
ncbi:beta-ketoacyl-[acyl-carrier-protein] synthase family protein [Streptomyces virginiae]|uniref:beta-ketoacyl-[acyl-carrier-protein] synthase family protein n=1 Tax=Streptomyces virginiae TaxID=1961 RepID=UPI00367D444C